MRAKRKSSQSRKDGLILYAIVILNREYIYIYSISIVL